MKTYETEKNNIPEGATHHGIYGCDTDVYFKLDHGVFLEWRHGNWGLSSFNHHDWVKPIPTETPEEKEALEKPKRVKVEYVKVEDSIFDLKEEFDREELYVLPLIGNGF